MARDRSDLSWQHADEPWKRLRWARETHGAYSSRAAFARAVHENEHTYRVYERSPDSSRGSSPDYNKAVAWADKLDVRWQWLLDGKGAPWRDEAQPAEKVREALTGLMTPEEVEQIASLTELLDRKRAG